MIIDQGRCDAFHRERDQKDRLKPIGPQQETPL